ncbi:plasmid SOS inhibition protein A [Pectobacterium versatile]|uniref:plasmid SOS inhibition protein A n=1 Tax=Pectobacterium versatile TaxID=2488639 RepID=UPI002B241AF9|nr:plasmid SOS inhibition protein A [Pectobacterium versatile]
MIPNNLSLVTLSPERQAALAAIVEVERRQAAGKRLSDYPYAHAYFRILTGTSRPRSADMYKTGYFSLGMPNSSIKRATEAFDVLLSSDGRYCPLPLDRSIQLLLFPEVVFKGKQRVEERWQLGWNKKDRLAAKQRLQHEVKRRNLFDSAVIDLNFQTPATISAWEKRWGAELNDFDNELDAAFWRWLQRFPSLHSLRKFESYGNPLWALVRDIEKISHVTSWSLTHIESLFVPNKLCVQQGGLSHE